MTTSRRSLFKRILGTAAAVTVASAVECFGVFEKPNLITEAIKKAKRIVINPAYMNAGYEDVIIFHPMVAKSLVAVRCSRESPIVEFENQIKDPRANRYNFKDGKWIQVPFYKEEDV